MIALQIDPAHKLVCGEHSHPFRLPPFSREEATEVLTYAAAPLETQDDMIFRIGLLHACGAQNSGEIDVSEEWPDCAPQRRENVHAKERGRYADIHSRIHSTSSQA